MKHLDHAQCQAQCVCKVRWYHFAASWNGVSMLPEHRKLNPDLVVTSDACGNWRVWSIQQGGIVSVKMG